MSAKTKTCTRCTRRRKVEQFYKDRYDKDGLSSWCKECRGSTTAPTASAGRPR